MLRSSSTEKNLTMKTSTVETKQPEFLTRRELLERWSICRESLRRMEMEGLINPVHLKPRIIRYRVADVEDYERKRQLFKNQQN